MNKILNDFENVDVSELKMPIISVFYNTLDIPEKYAARLFDLNRPTNIVVIKDTLEEIRSVIPQRYTRIDKDPNDDLSIVETWI
ncbi:hypothetical protein U8V72_15075 [Priestia filamentosa]|uniref:hypothetical protein n=1 Tax=Priestia filamentosa TaxID=1402861 RepID=UPI003977E77D